jgi:glycerophosphoryl diester phosphodiesterase
MVCIRCLCTATVLHAQLIVAHRGASFDAPENTRASSRLAWKHGADAIEGDFYLTRDQQIVCIHDPDTERVSGKNLPVAESTLAELQALDVGSWKDQRFAGERMPSLRELLTTVPDGKRIYIEVKCGPEIVPFLQRVVSESSLLPRQTIIISFNEDVIRAAKQAMPERQAYWLVDFQKDKNSRRWSPTIEEIISAAEAINADGVDVAGKSEVVNAGFMARCRQAGLSVHVWTIDDVEIAARFQQIGVASITTNRPAKLRERLFRTPATSPAPSPLPPVERVPAGLQLGPPSSPAEAR